MSKNFGEIKSTVMNRLKIDPSDTASINLLLTDANDCCAIVAGRKNWQELYKTGSVSLTAADGDINYELASDVERIELMAITSPVNYAVVLDVVPRANIINIVVQKTIGGTAQPTAWYYQPETISANNVATKNVSFNVMPDQAYTVGYWYRAFPPQIIVDANYPFFNGNYHWIVDNYLCWKYAERNPDPTINPDYFRGEWEAGLAQLLGNVSDDLMIHIPIPGPNPNVNGVIQVPPIR